ncbi:hypothetical protein RB595_010249 [Gaeumannomyces hyphopodioides]
MSGPRTKRQFAGAASDPAQRQITSFFSRQTPDQDGSLPQQQQQQQQQQQPFSRPALPAMVQSNLLSVGMRVRKSVAEGHKGGVGCDFSMWSDGAPQKPRVVHHHPPHQAPSPAAAAPAAAPHHTHQSFDPRSSSYVPLPGTSATRELLPFCGIHNVGGLSAQPDFDPSPALPTAVFGGLPPVPDASDVPGLSSSQESVRSTGSFLSSAAAAANSSRKRTYAGDEDDGDDDGSADEAADRRQGRGAGRGRVFAEPRDRRSRDPWSAAPLPPKSSRGQQGAVAVTANDFPEADFLDYRQYSPDLDMGGV